MYIPCIFSSTHYDDAQLSLIKWKNVSSGMRLSFPPLLQAVFPVLACLSDNKHFCGNRRVQNINKGPSEVAGGGVGVGVETTPSRWKLEWVKTLENKEMNNLKSPVICYNPLFELLAVFKVSYRSQIKLPSYCIMI